LKGSGKMTYKIELDTAQYVGLLERLIELNKEKPEIFLKENLIPAVQNAKIYDENPKEKPALL